jgi:SprT protein
VQEITDLIRSTLVQVAHEDLEIHWRWSSRFTSRMGDANYRTGELRFSRPLWPVASLDERRETIVHEVCHLVTYAEFGIDGWRASHGREWREVMSWAGYPDAKPYHAVPRYGVVSSIARAFCSCRTHEVSLTRAKRHVKGRTTLTCDRCDQPLFIATEDL